MARIISEDKSKLVASGDISQTKPETSPKEGQRTVSNEEDKGNFKRQTQSKKNLNEKRQQISKDEDEECMFSKMLTLISCDKIM